MVSDGHESRRISEDFEECRVQCRDIITIPFEVSDPAQIVHHELRRPDYFFDFISILVMPSDEIIDSRETPEHLSTRDE